MEFYIGLFALTAVVYYGNNFIKENHQKKIIIYLMFAILILVSGTRYLLGGSDYYVYQKCFNVVETLVSFTHTKAAIANLHLIADFEIGYLFLNSLIKTLGFSFYGFTLIEAVVWYACMYLGLSRYVRDWAYVLPLFLYKFFFYNTFISMRQSITIAIFFVAWRYIQEKKPVKYYGLCMLALLFHNGAILMFAIYPFMQLKLTKKRLIILNVMCWPFFVLWKLGYSIYGFVSALVGLLPMQSTMVSKAQTWLTFTESISTFHVLEYMLIMLLVIIFYDQIMEQDENAEFIVKIFLWLLPLFAICGASVLVTRFKDYFTITYGIIIMYLIQILKGYKKYLIQTVALVVCAFGFFRYIILFDSGALMPYASFFQYGISIFQ
jgi:hypothetical protein